MAAQRDVRTSHSHEKIGKSASIIWTSLCEMYCLCNIACHVYRLTLSGTDLLVYIFAQHGHNQAHANKKKTALMSMLSTLEILKSYGAVSKLLFLKAMLWNFVKEYCINGHVVNNGNIYIIITVSKLLFLNEKTR